MNDDFLDRLGAQLSLAAAAPLAPAPRRAWHPPGRTRATRRLVAGLVVALVATPALAVTRPWEPILGHPDTDHGAPTASTGPVSPAEARVLGVLRRPQTDDDRTSGKLLVSLHPGFDGVETAAVRLLRPGADAIALVPAERLFQNDQRTGTPLYTDALCLADADSVTCGSRDDLLAGRILNLKGTRVYGLVPDGVATVRVDFADGGTAEAPVSENLFELTSSHDAATVTSSSWLDQDGKVVGGLRPKGG
jgi:hypothetical protein